MKKIKEIKEALMSLKARITGTRNKTKKVFKKILKVLNLRIDSNQRWLLLSAAVGGLLTTYTNPTIMKELVSNLPAQWLAFQSLAYSAAGLLVGAAWKGCIRKNAMRFFLLLAGLETLCGIALGIYLLIEWNVWVFAVANLIYCSIVSTFISKCVMAFKAKLWRDKERETYDNNNSTVCSLVCIVGFLLALVFLPSLKTSIVLWTVYCTVDDLGWMYVYFKNRQTLLQPDEDEENEDDEK